MNQQHTWNIGGKRAVLHTFIQTPLVVYKHPAVFSFVSRLLKYEGLFIMPPGIVRREEKENDYSE